MLTRRSRCLLACVALLAPCRLSGQERIEGTDLAPGMLLFPSAAGNVVVAFGAEGAFVIGPLTVASTRAIQAALAGRTPSAARYVIAMVGDPAQSEGDGGWGRLGAFVATHENSRDRLAGQTRRLTDAGLDRPRVAFSQVIAFELSGAGVHVVHQPAGHSDADFLAHFHSANVVFLGESFPGDGYPLIDSARGGTLDGLIRTLDAWVGSSMSLVPARGPAVTGTEVRAFRDMLVGMRDRVRALAQEGRTIDEVVAARPSAEFDARYGNGRTSPEGFVRMVYRAVRSR